VHSKNGGSDFDRVCLGQVFTNRLGSVFEKSVKIASSCLLPPPAAIDARKHLSRFGCCISRIEKKNRPMILNSEVCFVHTLLDGWSRGVSRYLGAAGAKAY
jgi:hypothetical protein